MYPRYNSTHTDTAGANILGWFRNPQTTTWDVEKTMNTRISTTSTGAGFLPSTVSSILKKKETGSKGNESSDPTIDFQGRCSFSRGGGYPPWCKRTLIFFPIHFGKRTCLVFGGFWRIKKLGKWLLKGFKPSHLFYETNPILRGRQTITMIPMTTGSKLDHPSSSQEGTLPWSGTVEKSCK